MCLGTVVDVTTKLAIRLMSTKALEVNDLVSFVYDVRVLHESEL